MRRCDRQRRRSRARRRPCVSRRARCRLCAMSSASGRQMGAGRRQGGALRAAHEERSADPVLEGADAPAEGRLRHVTGLRRAREVALVRQGQKILEPVQIHGDAASRMRRTDHGIGQSGARPGVNGPQLPCPRRRPMRIIDVREITQPIASPIRNAYIDFSKMTASLVAVVTDVVRDGRRVVGYGFNSNGRYGQGGLIRERFRDRILEAAPESLLDESGDNLDPHKIWAAMMIEREAGRPRRALGGGRHARHGGVGRDGQDRRQAALPPARRAPRPRGQPARLRLRGRRLLLSGQGRHGACGPRCAATSTAATTSSR